MRSRPIFISPLIDFQRITFCTGSCPSRYRIDYERFVTGSSDVTHECLENGIRARWEMGDESLLARREHLRQSMCENTTETQSVTSFPVKVHDSELQLKRFLLLH